MSRDGSGVYHRPVGTDAVTDTTIESTKYNINVADVEQDLNLPRPIVAGGSGASSAAQALVNLGAEAAAQIVTNYDSQLWQAGSFYSASSATAAPVAGHSFSGICYVSDPLAYPPTNLNVTLEARDRDDTSQPGAVWVRTKKAGIWSAWANTNPIVLSPPGSPGVPPANAPDNSFWWDATRGKLFVRYNDGDSTQFVEAVAVPDVDPAAFVEIAGDTMTGPLVLAADPVIPLAAATRQYVDATSLGSIASGYLSWVSATQIRFAPWNGDAVRINGVRFQIPSAGMSIGNTGVFIDAVASQNLAASTLYYVYIFNNAGSLTASFSITAPAASTTPGNVGTLIKTGDDTRTLIGMVYTNASSQFVASNVISWFNKKARHTTAQGGYANATGQVPVEFCAWADEAISYHINTYMSNNVLNAYLICTPAVDGVAQAQLAINYVPLANTSASVSLSATRLLAAGRHVIAQNISYTGGATAGTGETSVMFRG